MWMTLGCLTGQPSSASVHHPKKNKTVVLQKKDSVWQYFTNPQLVWAMIIQVFPPPSIGSQYQIGRMGLGKAQSKLHLTLLQFYTQFCKYWERFINCLFRASPSGQLENRFDTWNKLAVLSVVELHLVLKSYKILIKCTVYPKEHTNILINRGKYFNFWGLMY